MLLKEEKTDLRILRTRRLLVQAMAQLLEEKDLQSITISDIADRAMINRATFYAHFADKYDLFGYIVRDFFQGVLRAEVSDTVEFNRTNLEKLSLSTITAVTQFHGTCMPGPRDQIQPMIETELQKELYKFIFQWLENDGYGIRDGSREVAAAVVSWTIFGIAMQHKEELPDQSVEDLAAQTAAILLDGLETARIVQEFNGTASARQAIPNLT